METAELRQIAACASKGESAAWDALYHEIGKISASVCRKNNLSPEDSEDAAQETAIAISGRLKELAAMENPEGYIRRVVNSKCIDIIRSQTKVPMDSMHEDEDYVLNMPDSDITPENEVAGLSADRMISDFIAELPEEQRVALVMRYCDGYTNAQIAKKLNVPPGTVASRVRYGKQALEKRITKYEKDNKIRLHAKFAFPFLPWRMFRNKSLQTTEIIATDGGSSVSGGARALTGFLTALVMGGAVIGTGFVMQDNNPHADETAPVQAATEQVEQVDPTAATVYKDVYETQVETVYETINSAQNAAEQTEQKERETPGGFKFAGNVYEPSKETLTSKTLHFDVLDGTLTFPDSWINNVVIYENNYYISIIDKGGDDNYQNALLNIYNFNVNKEELREFSETYASHTPYPDFSLNLGYYKHLGAGDEMYALYTFSTSWNTFTLNRTNLDYSKINSEIISVLESFRSDNSNYTSLLTQQAKDTVMKYNGSEPLKVP